MRTPGMSKGCKTCRDRRVKCDETQPECKKCRKSGRSCPGPVDGWIFLSAPPDKPIGSHRRDGAKPSQVNPQITAELKTAKDAALSAEKICQKEVNLFACLPVIGYPGLEGDDGTINVACHQYGPDELEEYEGVVPLTNASICAPRKSNALQVQVLSHFISTFTCSQSTDFFYRKRWIFELPDVLNHGWPRTLHDSILAASLIHYGVMAQEAGLVHEAQRFYVSSIQRQRNSLLHLSGTSKPTVRDVATSLLLAYFEVCNSSSPNAYFQHILGATACLDLIGPKACREGQLHALLLTTRMHMVYVSTTLRKPCLLARREWMTEPYLIVKKRPLDRMIDISLRIPRTLAAIDAAKLQKGSQTSDSTSSLENLERELMDILPTLDTETWSSEPRSSYLGKYIPPYHDLDNPRDALVVAYYSAAWITLLVERRKLGVYDESADSVAMKLHANAVLAAANCVDTCGNGCSYIRSIFPLRMVYSHSPDKQQRDQAQQILEDWRTGRGMGGICAIALNQWAL